MEAGIGTTFFKYSKKEKKCEPLSQYPVKITFRNEGEIKVFSKNNKN